MKPAAASATATSASRHRSIRGASLVVIGAASLALYLQKSALPHFPYGIEPFAVSFASLFILYLIGICVVIRAPGPDRTLSILVLLGAMAFRLTLLSTTPVLSSDIYRYIWDGRVQSAGINPYRYVPEDEHLNRLRDGRIFPLINRRDSAHTIYPPVSQLICLLAYRLFPDSVTAMKFLMILFDTGTLVILISILGELHVCPARVIIYAWNPLVVWEVAHSGHIDAAAVAFLLLAVYLRLRTRLSFAGIALGLAALTKIYPLVLFPALFKKWDWRLPSALGLTVLVGYLPYLTIGLGALGFLPRYLVEEGYATGERFYLLYLLDNVVGVGARSFLVVAAVVMVALSVKMILVGRDGSRRSILLNSTVLCACALLLASPRYPWYTLWLVAFTTLIPSAGLIYFSGAAMFSYLNWLEPKHPGISKLVWHIQYLPTYLILLGEWARRRISDARVGGRDCVQNQSWKT